MLAFIRCNGKVRPSSLVLTCALLMTLLVLTCALRMTSPVQSTNVPRYADPGSAGTSPGVLENAADFGFTQIKVVGVARDGAGGFTLQFGGNNVVNATQLMPCADDDSRDMAYMRGIFAFIESQSEIVDTTKVFAEGQ